jgi:EAL domain-containing protein (putative c-di-GMP-specific phosphodiesterase class I)/GGDEF domain-containing protein
MQKSLGDTMVTVSLETGFRARLIFLMVLAAAAPLSVLVWRLGDSQPLAVMAAAVTSLAAVIMAGVSVWPMSRVASALDRVVDAQTEGHARSLSSDPRDMTAQISILEARLHELSVAASYGRPANGAATRERFLAATAAAIGRGSEDPKPAILGLVRFSDYDGLSAFDPPAADEARAAFAARLLECVGPARLVGQVRRNCFAVWFDGAEDPSELQAMAYVLTQEMTAGEVKLSPRVALGAALYPRDGEDPNVLLARAETALAETGQASVAKPAFFDPDASAGARRRFQLAQDARAAVQHNQFSLHYQPVVDLVQSRVVGAEALLRWTHPEFGPVSPAEFVPVLEQAGQMEEVGLWVLNAACRQAKQWQSEGVDLTVAVNLSVAQCGDPELGALVARTLARHGLDAHRLELELTETAAMTDGDATRKLLTELKALGVGVAIDDFGAGYSSLTYLKNLPFSKLKIDREFVTHVDDRADSQAICAALIALSRGLGIQVLAEGVERLEELETLRGLGCPLIQGFYFSKPLAPAEFITTVRDPEWLTLLASPVHRQRALLETRASR